MIQPIGDQIIIKLYKPKDVSDGGIILTPNAKQGKRQGEVVAVGPGRYLKSGIRAPIDLKIGDTVLYGAAGGTPFGVGEETVMIMQSSNIIAVVNE